MTTTAETETTASAPGRSRWFVLAFLSAGVTMIMIDATIVNVSVRS